MMRVVETGGTAGANATVYVTLRTFHPKVNGPVRCFVKGTGKRGHRHDWWEMDHYGMFGTGFAQCDCGAIGSIKVTSA